MHSNLYIPVLVLFLLVINSCKPDRYNPWDEKADPKAWAPKNLHIKTNFLDKSIALSWEYDINTHEGFMIDRKKNNEPWQEEYAILEKHARSFTESLLDSGEVIYRYRVYAYLNQYNSEKIEVASEKGMFYCEIETETTGTTYNITITPADYFNQGDMIKVTMESPDYVFGQADNVSLYNNEDLIHDYGNWLTFNYGGTITSNAREFSLPTEIPASNCYTIRVIKGEDIYVSEPFTVIP